MGIYALTHALEFLLQISLVLAIGNPKVVIGILSLVNAVSRSGRPDGQDRRRALCPLGLSEFLHGHTTRSHFFLERVSFAASYLEWKVRVIGTGVRMYLY